MMLLTLLTVLTLSPLPADATARQRAAQHLEGALESAGQERGESLAKLDVGIEAARAALGHDSELAADLARLARGARFEAAMAEDDGAAWLAGRLKDVVSDLRFVPVQEAELPAGFPEFTPVGEIRLQRYPAYRMARTAMRGAREQGAFWKLFIHIQRNDIAMTAPVETTFDLDRAGLAESSMAFLYASQSLGSTGDQGAVEVIDVPARTVVSIGLRGSDSAERIESARRRLERWIAARPEWSADGPLRTMGHNSPMVFGDRRYFEVQIPVTRAGETVIDFSDADEARSWQSVDDVVMGGRSSSRIVPTVGGTTLFTGNLSLENNGGFASVRKRGERGSLAGASAVVLRVRGDGRSYRLRLWTDTRLGGTSYQATFETRAGEWVDVTLALADFEPRWRGRLVRSAPQLDPGAVRGFGLMIADKQTGPFRLELGSLRKVAAGGAEPGTLASLRAE